MRILIIRHADPDYSIDSLTETGWKEARLLCDKLKKDKIDAFYVSPLGRAKDTASFTLEALGKNATECGWLREFWPQIKRPDYDGRVVAWDWLPEDWTGDPRFFDKDHWFDNEIMQEAGVKEAYMEVCNGLDGLLEKHGYRRSGTYYQAVNANEDTIALVCHFGMECVLLSHLLNISPMPLWHGTCALPSSVTTLYTEERRQGKAYFRMTSFGDTSHLYVAGQEPSFSARFCETFYREDQRHD